MDINRASETIRENIGNYALKKHKPSFDKDTQNYQIKGKKAKLQWLQDPRELNGDNLNSIRKVQTREPLGPDPIPFEVETVIAKLKKYESPGNDQIPAELIQAGGETLRSESH